MLSASLEDYLEEIYRLSVNKGCVRTSDIAQCLGVTLPSVSKALQRLHEEGFIHYEPYRDIKLTSLGNTKGEYLVKRNQILQNFLQIIGANCDIAAEAEAMEHYLTKPTIHAIKNLVQFLQKEDYQQKFKRFLNNHPMQES